MFKQIQFVRKEIEDHEAVKDLMEESVRELSDLVGRTPSICTSSKQLESQS
jgi:hypothetical protein